MLVSVTLAILYNTQGQFLIQLRDDTPGIVYPNHWGLFGGHMEEHETPSQTVKRELKEEIGIEIDGLKSFRVYELEGRIRHVFSAPLNISTDLIVLGEGMDFALVDRATIETGEHYSPIGKQVYPFVPFVKEVLLDFLDKGI
ncbi:MAG: NUDIX domain-containing protein [Cyanobacteriota bacterium ELA615]|jgi:8-oxo-dGTP pyrophosphatase MutT (NUDIX family)